MLNSDYRDMLQSLLDENVEFLIVGAYALAVHGIPRATGDIDIWVRPSADNAQKVLKALARFGAPVADIDYTEFTQEDIVFQIGLAPRRIDILTGIDGIQFEEASIDTLTVDVGGMQLPVISRDKLILNKLATGRPKDMLDIDALENNL